MQQLIQKVRREKQSFTIVEEGLEVEINHSIDKESYLINFDEILTNEFVMVKAADWMVLLFVFSSVFNAILLNVIIMEFSDISAAHGIYVFLGLLGVLAIIFISLKEHFTRVNIKILEVNNSKKPLAFFYTLKTKDEVDAFITTIQQAKREYFRKKYFKVDPIISFFTQKERFVWLYEKQYITEKEYWFILEALETQRVIAGEL